MEREEHRGWKRKFIINEAQIGNSQQRKEKERHLISRANYWGMKYSKTEEEILYVTYLSENTIQ